MENTLADKSRLSGPMKFLSRDARRDNFEGVLNKQFHSTENQEIFIS